MDSDLPHVLSLELIIHMPFRTSDIPKYSLRIVFSPEMQYTVDPNRLKVSKPSAVYIPIFRKWSVAGWHPKMPWNRKTEVPKMSKYCISIVDILPLGFHLIDLVEPSWSWYPDPNWTHFSFALGKMLTYWICGLCAWSYGPVWNWWDSVLRTKPVFVPQCFVREHQPINHGSLEVFSHLRTVLAG